MAQKNRSVFGIYATADAAERTVNTLINDGFPSQDVSVLMPDQRSTREFAHHKDTKAPEGATAGATAGGAVGGFLGALVGMGIPEYEARRYEGRVKDGGILLSVHCETPGEILRAREILTSTGATDIASSTESAGAVQARARTVRPGENATPPK